MNCQGPCLEHCYHSNKINYFIFGLILGLFISIGLKYITPNQKRTTEKDDRHLSSYQNIPMPHESIWR